MAKNVQLHPQVKFLTTPLRFRNIFKSKVVTCARRSSSLEGSLSGVWQSRTVPNQFESQRSRSVEEEFHKSQVQRRIFTKVWNFWIVD